VTGVLAQIRANEASVDELRWRQARASRVITNALCATDSELTGAPFQAVLAEVQAILAAPLPGGDPKAPQSSARA
jgi:hypothetical protein